MAANILSMKRQWSQLNDMYEAGVNDIGDPLTTTQLRSIFMDMNSLEMAIGLAEDRKARRDALQK